MSSCRGQVLVTNSDGSWAVYMISLILLYYGIKLYSNGHNSGGGCRLYVRHIEKGQKEKGEIPSEPPSQRGLGD